MNKARFFFMLFLSFLLLAGCEDNNKIKKKPSGETSDQDRIDEGDGGSSPSDPKNDENNDSQGGDEGKNDDSNSGDKNDEGNENPSTDSDPDPTDSGENVPDDSPVNDESGSQTDEDGENSEGDPAYNEPDSDGEISDEDPSCTVNTDCPENFYCQKEIGGCGAHGICVEKPGVCPDVWSPVCGCDNETYENECRAAAEGVSIDHEGKCAPQPGECTENMECNEKSFCKKEDGSCYEIGTCALLPKVCPEIYEPVCGCDNITYDNRCEAYLNGVSVKEMGHCSPFADDCTENSDCNKKSFCKKAVGICHGFGTCTLRPEFCPPTIDLVCGCDNNTYKNDCLAEKAGVSIRNPGKCGF